MIVGYDDLNAARAVALDYSEGAHLVDTNAQTYHPVAPPRGMLLRWG